MKKFLGVRKVNEPLLQNDKICDNVIYMKRMYKRNTAENLALLLKSRAESGGDYFIQAAKDKDGNFVYYRYSEFYRSVLALAKKFKSLGITKGTNVALISDNRREWFLTDNALLALGAIDVPRGCDSLGKEIRFIISFAECKYGFFENFRQLEKVLEKAEEVPLLKTAVLFEKDASLEKDSDSVKRAAECGVEILFFEDMLCEAEKEFALDEKNISNEIEADMKNVTSDDVATIIFTSGTTGVPKGVMLTHRNYLEQLSVIQNFIPCKKGDWWMTVLPVWHSFERFIQYIAVASYGGLAYSKPAAPILMHDFAAIKPQWICGVPRLWEALVSGINRAMNKKGGISLKLYNFFIRVGKKYAVQKDKVFGNVCRFKKNSHAADFFEGLIPFLLLWPLHKLGDLLVYRKIREKFGGKITIAVSGGGALQKEIDLFYKAIGLELLEGYGLSETAPVVSVRDFRHPRSGCVGVVLPSNEVKIVKEENGVIAGNEPLGFGQKGLILVRGGQIMKGYYNRPDLTQKAIDKDGWLNTGDIGCLTYDNEIIITGRAKDTIVLLDGENIEPAVIEAALLEDKLIESAMVTGQDKKYLGCLIVPSKENVLEYAAQENIEYTEYEELLKNKKIIQLYQKILNERVSIKNGFRNCETVYRFVLLSESFKPGEELSAKQEMMRHKISEKYAEQIKSMF